MPHNIACPPSVSYFSDPSVFLTGLCAWAIPRLRKAALVGIGLLAVYGLPNAANPTYAATFTVTNINDSGAGSLRQAILDANTNAGLDTISFTIGGGGIPTIQPQSQLPAFTSPVLLLATSLDGSSCNTWPPTVGIELDGSLAGAGVDGLRFTAGAGGSQVSGLAINRFSQDGIDITVSNVRVACNYIGVDKTGTMAAGNSEGGVLVWGGVNNTIVGYHNAWVGNVIAANGGSGVYIWQDGADNNIVRGNYLGTDKLGTQDLGNHWAGVFLGYGAARNIVGGPSTRDRNLISGNNIYGIQIFDSDTPGGEHQILGNYIGTTAGGGGALPNGGTGIQIFTSPSNTVGGLSASSSNLIAFNLGNGVAVIGSKPGNRIQGNEIVSNSLLGIDLTEIGQSDGTVTLNDVGDGDAGPNGLQNFPVLSQASRVLPGATIVSGTLNSAANTLYDLEFFSNGTCDASGNGEGQRFLGRDTVTTNPSGNGTFLIGLGQLVPSGSSVVATATDPNGNTSEFSACIAVTESTAATSQVVIPRSDGVTTNEDTPVTIDVLVNDLNLGGSGLVLAGVGTPSVGTAQVVNNQVLYTPAANFIGTTSFFYSVHNGQITRTVQATVRVTVVAVNDAPTDITLSPSSIAENLPVGTRVGLLSASDPDGDTEFVFDLVGTGNDNAVFRIVRNELSALARLDFETRSSYTVRVSATDRNGAAFEKNLSVSVINASDPPSAILLSNNRLAENQAAGVTVGTLSSIDADAGETFSYALVPGVGSNHNANFSIDGATLRTTALLDYETQMIHSIRVRSTDSLGAAFEQTFVVNLTDVASPPDAPVNILSKCSGNPITLIDANANDLPKRVLVKIDNIVVSNKTATGCNVTGKLTITTNGNTQANITFTGTVNDKDQFATGTLSDFNLSVAGLTLQAKEVSIEYYLNRPSLRIAKPALQMPGEWGGLSASLSLPSIIDNNGLKFGTGKISLPTLKTKSGFELDLSGSLVPVAGGWQIAADGALSIPNVGKNKAAGKPGQTCTINAGVTIFVGAFGQTVLHIETEAEQTTKLGVLSPVSFNALRLDKIRAGFSCEQGIAIGTTGMFLTSLSGEITLTPNSEAVNVAVKIVAGKSLPVLGPVIGLDGTMNLQINPSFKLDLGVALNVLSFKIATAQATITKNSFATTIRITGLFIQGTASINAWSSDGKFHFTGSGRMSLEVRKGSISSTCGSVPCGVRFCKKWGIPYPCGVNFCNVCLNFPPFDTGKLAEVGADVGEFTNGRYGFKGFISIIGTTVGFYVDESGKLSFGNVSQYQLIQAPTVAAAHQAWLQGLKSKISLRPDAFAPYTFIEGLEGMKGADGAGSAVIINTPLIKSATPVLVDRAQPFGALGATDVISKVNLIKEADVSFGMKARGLLTLTLITPQGNEITPLNLPSNIVYSSSVSYERESGEASDPTQARLRFTPLSSDPAVNGVDVRVDGVTVYVNTSQTSPELLEYIAVTPGDHLVELVQTGTNSVVMSGTIDMVEGYDYTLLTVRRPPAAARSPQLFSDLILINDDNRPPTAAGQARVRLYNGFSSNLTLRVNGVDAVSGLPYQAVSNYDVLAAGRHTLQVVYAGSGIPASAPMVVDAVEGDVYTFFAAEDPLGVNDAAILQRSDESYVRHYVSEYNVDQADLGEWKVKLVGDTDNIYYLISIVGPASPPVLSEMTVNASNPAATQVNWRLTSDNSPTTIQIYVNPGPITHSITVTGINGLPNTLDVPAYEGFVAAEFVLSGPTELGGQLVSRVIDLSKLTSGTYHVWMRAQDGISPPVNGYLSQSNAFAKAAQFDVYGRNAVRVAKNGYSALAQLADAAPIVVNHASDFPTTWAATIVTTLTTDTDSGSLYVQWNANSHPDVDSYRLLFNISTTTTMQVITAGGEVAEFDQDGKASGGAYGFTALDNIEPGATYSLTVEAIDSELSRSVRSQSVAFLASPGNFALTAPQPSYAVARNAQITVPVSLVELQALFFKQVGLGIDLGQSPLGINAGFVGDVDGTTALSPSQATAQLNISVDGVVPDGRYPVRVYGYNGNQKQSVAITVVVGKQLIYLPVAKR